MKRLVFMLVLVLIILLSSLSVFAWNGYVATDYDLEEKGATVTLHLQKKVFLGFHMGTTVSTVRGEEGIIPSGLAYDLWAGVVSGSWSVKISRVDTYRFGEPFGGTHKYVARLRYDF